MGAAGRTRLESLIEAHGAAVAAYLRRRLHPLPAAVLDDLVEETFLVLWRRERDVPDGEAERPWVLGVARNVLHNAHRAQRRRVRHEARLRPRGSAPSAEEVAVVDLAAHEALSRLSEPDRELLRLHFWDGVDVDGIATLLSITPNAAGTRLSRAKGRFVEQLRELDEREEDGTASAPADMGTTWHRGTR